MSWFVEPFTSNLFMSRALVAGVLVAVACAVVGTFVVLRGLAFIGDALAHGVLPGVAGAVVLGVPGSLGAVVGALAMIAGVRLVTRHSRLSSDTAIGLLFVGMLALGVVVVSRSRTFTGDLVGILFGELLGISAADLWVQAGATAAVVVVAVLCARPFLLLSYDQEQADVAGFPSRRYHTAMLVLIALTVVVSFQTVGTLLVFGMLLAPAGVGALLARRVGAMVAWAIGVGAVSVYLGLLASYHWDVAGGAAVVLCAVAAFFVALTGQAVARWAGSRPGPPADRSRPVGAEVVDPRQVRTAPAPARAPAPAPAPGGGAPVVAARGLAVGYGGRAVLAGVDVELRPGQLLALVGTNGSGKSTLLKTVAGLLPPVAGELHVAGGRPGRPPRGLAYVSQLHTGSSILPLRVRDVVRMGRYAAHGLVGRLGRADEELVDEALARTGTTALAARALGDLSGGQRQRARLAQALARRADLLVLDEPTAGIDAAGREVYEEAVDAELARGAAVVVATHDLGDAERAGEVLLLAGRVVAQGAPDEVLTAEHLLDAFGVGLRPVAGGLIELERPHGHDHGPGHGHEGPPRG